MKRYTDILKNCGADAWELIDVKTTGWEFYFIGHKLDQNRAKEVEHITFKVYKKSEDGASLGIAAAEVSPTESEDGIKKIAAGLVYQASLVKNKPYELNQPADVTPVQAEITPLETDAADFIKTMQEIAETETEDLNSYEIFVNRNTRRLITSEGIDVTEEYPTSTLDVVVNARKDDHEIELYRLYQFGSCDRTLLKADIEELLHIGRDRLIAEQTPSLGKCAVVLSTDAALSVYEYFLDNLNAALLVRGMSSFEIGKPIAEEFTGDRVTIESLRNLPGSPKNFSCDPEGAPVRDCILMEAGVPKQFVGIRMFASYLGLENAFSVTNWSISGGAKTAEEIREGKFLEVVEFSDFQVDGMTGDIFGEIRLGYFHDGEGNVRPVTGGSLSGTMTDNLGHMFMTKETRCYANAEIPKATRLEFVTVTGS